MTALLIGEAPTAGREREPAFSGSSGRRLAALAGLTEVELRARLETANLLDRPATRRAVGEGSTFPVVEASAAADRFSTNGHEPILLAGRRVARAFGLDAPWYAPVELRARRAHVIPHPSGVSRHWNSIEARLALRDFLAAQLAPAVRDAYDAVAPRYASGFGSPLERAEDARWLAAVRRAVEPGGILLDVGSGLGELPAALEIDPDRYLGVEPSIRMRAHAEAKLPRHRFLAGGFPSMPAEVRSVDALCAGWGVGSYGGVLASLREAARVLRPGGRLAAVVYGPAHRYLSPVVDLSAVHPPRVALAELRRAAELAFPGARVEVSPLTSRAMAENFAGELAPEVLARDAEHLRRRPVEARYLLLEVSTCRAS